LICDDETRKTESFLQSCAGRGKKHKIEAIIIKVLDEYAHLIVDCPAGCGSDFEKAVNYIQNQELRHSL